MGIRSTAKAFIVHNGKVLLTRCYDRKNGDYYALPGGGQEKFEPLPLAVVRECKEETGYTVLPLKLLAVCEEICESAHYREKYPQYAHKLYHIFLCGLAGEEKTEALGTDDLQTGFEWVDVSLLPQINLLPKLVKENAPCLLAGSAPFFLGTEFLPFNHG